MGKKGSTPFYQYTEADFRSAPASEVKTGDFIAYGDLNSDFYGAIQITDVLHLAGNSICLSWNLPDSVCLTSSDKVTLQAEWINNTRVVRVWQYREGNEPTLIRKD